MKGPKPSSYQSLASLNEHVGHSNCIQRSSNDSTSNPFELCLQSIEYSAKVEIWYSHEDDSLWPENYAMSVP